MEIKLGKWEKGEMRRIYFNAPALGSAKVFAYADKSGIFTLGKQITTPGQGGAIYEAENEGVVLIEKLLGKSISFDTEFDDVWEAVK